MPDLRQTRKKIQTAVVAMGIVDVLALAIYISPLVGSADTRRQEINRLQGELAVKTRQVEPLKNLDTKVKTASHQIAEFYTKRFPAQYSEIATQLGKLTSANGMTIEQAKYTPRDIGPGRLQPVEMDAELVGNYNSLAHFINALERSDMFFIINSVSLGGDQQGPVKLNMKLETYLKARS